MPNQRIFGLLFFVICLCCLSTTTAQMSIDRIAVPVATANKGKKMVRRQVRKTGPRHKNPLASARQRLRNRNNYSPTSSRRMPSATYKNQRFKRVGKATATTAPRRRQLMGPAYKNRRFKVRRTRVAKFKRRR